MKNMQNLGEESRKVSRTLPLQINVKKHSWENYKLDWSKKYFSEAYLEPYQKTKMERFAKIVNG